MEFAISFQRQPWITYKISRMNPALLGKLNDIWLARKQSSMALSALAFVHQAFRTAGYDFSRNERRSVPTGDETLPLLNADQPFQFDADYKYFDLAIDKMLLAPHVLRPSGLRTPA